MSVEAINHLSAQHMAINGRPARHICPLPKSVMGYVIDGLDCAIEHDFCTFAVTMLYPLVFIN
jgi:hypothetical protein